MQHSNSTVLSIDASRSLFPVSRDLYGLFFEEISRAGDGGLYAELVQNRSFEDSLLPERCAYNDGKLVSAEGWTAPFPEPGSIPGWEVVQQGNAKIQIALDAKEILNPANPLSLRLEIPTITKGMAGIRNKGFWGIPVLEGEKYRFSLYLKMEAPTPTGTLNVRLEGENGLYASTPLTVTREGWNKYEAVLESNSSDRKAELVISFATPGTFWVDLVSLLPRNTFKNEYSCFRTDLVNLLSALKPRFLRFPGGCFVEGFSIETASRWKTTIGDVSQRQGQWNLWNYRTTNGIGFHDYLQFCEDLGMEAMFVINCGMSCQSRRGELVALDRLDEWIQDALDAVEYANGPASSTWGAIRAQNGHPKPFNMKYLEIGNENSGPDYNTRYKMFYAALKQAWPELILISNTHTEKDGLPTEIVDEHFYNDSYFFTANHDLYDTYDRRGPKVYVGEYANVVDCGIGNLGAAISEAAFLTGLERNQDVVVMCSYAPLLANVNHRSWHPDAIYFDTTRSFATPSYQLIKMFAENRGDVVLSATLDTERSIRFLSGCAGFESVANQASFRNVTVTSGKQTLFSSGNDKDSPPWRAVSGKWAFEDGTLHVSESAGDNVVLFGDLSWGGYTLSCDARISEGDHLHVRMLDNGRTGGERNLFVWEIGAGGESRIRHLAGGFNELIGPSVPFSLKPGKWNQLRVTLEGSSIKCHINGELVNDAVLKPIPAICAVSTYDIKKREIVVKLVNATPSEQKTRISILGAAHVLPEASLEILTSAHARDENSFDHPFSVIPRRETFTGAGREFTYSVPACSAVVMRIKTRS